MEKQHCRVGSITALTDGEKAIALLEYQYEIFIRKAADLEYANTKLGEFFEQKALKIQKTLENLVG